jgi:hypothetical protein
MKQDGCAGCHEALLLGSSRTQNGTNDRKLQRARWAITIISG